MNPPPTWIEPGQRATLVWYEAARPGPDGARVYDVAGPALEKPPDTRYYVLAPVASSEFADRLYRHQVDLAALRAFLQQCVLAEGHMNDSCEWVVTRSEAAALPLLDAWLALERPLVPYLRDINAFLPGSLPVYVSADAYEAVQRTEQTFVTAWVCQECGDADDLGVFLWTAHRPDAVRVCLLIENDAGRWTCHLHPFEFASVSLSTSGERAG